jgi:pimeloyl-ACP methyl ester carboxylesterase
MILLTFLLTIFFKIEKQQALLQYEITVEGLTCYAYSYANLEDEKPLLFFVHGSPGDHSAWDKYLKDSVLQQKYRIMALDRPGFGQSVSADTIAFPDLDFQAKVVRAFIKKYVHGQKVTLVGHSVGGPIVSLVAAKYPTEISNLVLLAPAISAEHEQPRFYNRLAQKKWLNKKIPFEMRVSQIEMMNIAAQLEDMQPLLSEIQCKTWLFHGKMDMIAPYGNALYVKENFKNAPLVLKTYPFQNHFLPWTKFEDIKKLLVILP